MSGDIDRSVEWHKDGSISVDARKLKARIVTQAVLQAAYDHCPSCQGGHNSDSVSGWVSCLEYLARTANESASRPQPARGEVSDATKVIALALAHITNGIPNAKEVAADAMSQAAALEAAARVRAGGDAR